MTLRASLNPAALLSQTLKACGSHCNPIYQLPSQTKVTLRRSIRKLPSSLSSLVPLKGHVSEAPGREKAGLYPRPGPVGLSRFSCICFLRRTFLSPEGSATFSLPVSKTRSFPFSPLQTQRVRTCPGLAWTSSRVSTPTQAAFPSARPQLQTSPLSDSPQLLHFREPSVSCQDCD